MEFFNSVIVRNITFVHPPYFIISGFTGTPNVKYYFVFLCFIFIVSVVGNSAAMAVIILDHNLRSPKYVDFNLALTDLLSSCAFLPKVPDIFLFNHQYISYNDCLTFMLFCFLLLSMSLNLVVLSFDRVIAIMYPLHYRVKVTYKLMLSWIAFFWLVVITLRLIAVGLLTRLSFCNSVVINSYFCDHGQIYRLSCNDHFPNYVLSCLF
ncbi:LOW QUALITY PROTEIN: olfactory receptor 5K16-like [Pholidichthys leucotaenia]